MIVKNEAKVVRRCLASVRPLLDYWVVVDTGSTDGTQDIVRQAMSGLPGEVVQRPWVDFAHNRSEALSLARQHGTYSLIIDADDELDDRSWCATPWRGAIAVYCTSSSTARSHRRRAICRS